MSGHLRPVDPQLARPDAPLERPVTKGKINARMTTRWISSDVQLFEMFAPGSVGKEAKMMEIKYTRR